MIQTCSKENPMVNINWSMIFKVLNESTTESTHLLWECPFARNVWALCRGKLQKCHNSAQDIFMLFRCLLYKLQQQKLERWALTGATGFCRSIKGGQLLMKHRCVSGLGCGCQCGCETQQFLKKVGAGAVGFDD